MRLLIKGRHTPGLLIKVWMRLFIKGMGTLGPFIKKGADACNVNTDTLWALCQRCGHMPSAAAKERTDTSPINAATLLKQKSSYRARHYLKSSRLCLQGFTATVSLAEGE